MKKLKQLMQRWLSALESILLFAYKTFFLWALLCSFSSCQRYSASYEQQYAYLSDLKNLKGTSPLNIEADYELLIFLDARHLDYEDVQRLIESLIRNPLTHQRSLDVGHAWVRLNGRLNGKRVSIEGGHTGEWGIHEPRYVLGVTEAIRRGEPNPISYLWKVLQDGAFQEGNGGHQASFVAQKKLEKAQFEKILEYISLENYNYRHYALTQNQCSSFVRQVAILAGLDLKDKVQVKVPQYIKWAGHKVKLWTNPKYAEIEFSSPDRLERSLVEAVKLGKMQAFAS